AARAGLALDRAGYVRTGAGVSSTAGALDGWQLARQPLPLETNLPGLFAAGDVRSGSIKRCAAAIGEGSMAVALVHQRLAEIGGARREAPAHNQSIGANRAGTRRVLATRVAAANPRCRRRPRTQWDHGQCCRRRRRRETSRAVTPPCASRGL